MRTTLKNFPTFDSPQEAYIVWFTNFKHELEEFYGSSIATNDEKELIEEILGE